MHIDKVNGLVTVTLTEEECALMGRSLVRDAARLIGLDVAGESLLLANLGAALLALGLAAQLQGELPAGRRGAWEPER